MSFILVAHVKEAISSTCMLFGSMLTSMQDLEWQRKKVFHCVENQTQLQERGSEV